MRIAFVAPLFETVPPKKYGGTERFAHFIIEELVHQGHDVTLFGCQESQTSAKLVSCYDTTLRDDDLITVEECKPFYVAQLERVFAHKPAFDVIHVNHGTFDYHASVMQKVPKGTAVVWTDHMPLDRPGGPDTWLNLEALSIKLTALSNSHRKALPEPQRATTILHGLPVDLLSPVEASSRSYVAFLGRTDKRKGVVPAINITKKAGLNLKIAAKVEDEHLEFFNTSVKPLLDDSSIEFIGEINEKQKPSFLSNAHALIFPIGWAEPFGLVMIEAAACGCPVVAYRQGSVPEVIEEGVTGFIVDNEEEAAEALKRAATLDRALIRQRFEERFSAARMTNQYLQVYEQAATEAKFTAIVEQSTETLTRVLSESSTLEPQRPVFERRRTEIAI